MVRPQPLRSLFVELKTLSALMSETAENAAASLRVQLEISKRIVEMTRQITTMTDLTREANRAYESLSDILSAMSSISSNAIQVDEISVGIQRLEMASQSMPKSKPMFRCNNSSLAAD